VYDDEVMMNFRVLHDWYDLLTVLDDNGDDDDDDCGMIAIGWEGWKKNTRLRRTRRHSYS